MRRLLSECPLFPGDGSVFQSLLLCVRVSYFLFSSPPLLLSLGLFSFHPSLAHTQNEKRACYSKLRCFVVVVVGGIFCFVLFCSFFFFRKCYYVKSIHTDPGSTGLPPHTGRGGANGKGPVIAEVTHLGLASVSGSWVSSSQEH